ALIRQEADTRGTGKPDVWITYTNGEKATQEELLDAEGKARVRYTFQNGKLSTKEILGDLPADLQRQEVIKK
ncbi:MAG TPA: hypothetical protein VFM04_07740, partial [Candidatus Methylomirabilis sp.]|nr:hypothetical protein [Candidatus Methylomirabilis sp.]